MGAADGSALDQLRRNRMEARFHRLSLLEGLVRFLHQPLVVSRADAKGIVTENDEY